MTSSDRAFKPALFSEERYFHVNLFCVLQRSDKSPAVIRAKRETTGSFERGQGLVPLRAEGEDLGDFLCSTGDQSLCIMSSREG